MEGVFESNLELSFHQKTTMVVIMPDEEEDLRERERQLIEEELGNEDIDEEELEKMIDERIQEKLEKKKYQAVYRKADKKSKPGK